MIFKATTQSRDCWSRFTVKLQGYSIQDANGETLSKRDVFERLYTDEDPSNVQIELLISNIHSQFTLAVKESYKDELLRQQHIEEVTDAELRSIAITFMRGTPNQVEATTNAMRYVLESHRQIEAAIKEKSGF